MKSSQKAPQKQTKILHTVSWASLEPTYEASSKKTKKYQKNRAWQ